MNPSVAKKVDEFFSHYRLRKYSAGQILILDGDTTNYIYYIVKGKVKEYDVSYRGDEVILHVFKPPAFFPVSQAINKQSANKFIYEAETDIEIRQAPDTDVIDFIKDNPDVMFDLLGRLYQGLDSILGKMVQLMTGSAKNRLIYEILEEARRFGTKDKDDNIVIHLNERQLASRAGLSRETVSRELHKIIGESVVLRPKSIIIRDQKSLENQLHNSF